MNFGVIYKITNPSGNCYIGKTVNWAKRHNQYKKLQCKDQPALYNSLVKHGIKNHTFDILEEKFPETQLNQQEKYYIAFYDSMKKGLNCTLGGDDSPATYEAARKKISISMQGNKNGVGKRPPRTKEHKENHAKAMKGKVPWNKGKSGLQVAWNKGVPMSEEEKEKRKGKRLSKKTKQKISKAHIGKKASYETRKKMSQAQLLRWKKCRKEF